MGRDGVLLYLDEIQYFNKKQQQTLLEFIENGSITLIASTTENPYFEVNGALISRSAIFELRPLEKEDIKELILRAVTDKERGLGGYDAVLEEDALEFLADLSGGDARNALNAIELGILTTERSADGKIHITLSVAEECIQRRAVRYDKDGDNHYDTISAFIKSMRGSDPDAAVYYLARMLEAGEDPLYVARRVVRFASEDVGLAYPLAAVVTRACCESAKELGMPEAQIPLIHAAMLLATAPKSNSAYGALHAAMADVEAGRGNLIPTHLQSPLFKGYKYPHDYPNHYVKQQYLPDGLKSDRYYEYGDNKTEQAAKKYWDLIKGESK